jgi:hypothetical protein
VARPRATPVPTTDIAALECNPAAPGVVPLCGANRLAPALALRGLRENLVHLAPCGAAAIWFQIPHGAFHVGMTKPLLNGAQIDSRPQAFRSERRSKKAACIPSFRIGYMRPL